MPEWLDREEPAVRVQEVADPDLAEAYALLQSHKAWKDLVRVMQAKSEKAMKSLSLDDLDQKEHTAGRLVGWIACSQFIQRHVALQAKNHKR